MQRFAGQAESQRSQLSRESIIAGGFTFASFFLVCLYAPLFTEIPSGVEALWSYILTGWIILGFASIVLGIVAYERAREQRALWGAALGSITLSIIGAAYLIVSLEAKLPAGTGFDIAYSSIVISVTCLIELVVLIGFGVFGKRLAIEAFKFAMRSAQVRALLADRKRLVRVSIACVVVVAAGVSVWVWYPEIEELTPFAPPQPEKPASFEISDGHVKAIYHLEDTTDASGNGYDLIEHNDVVFALGKLGNAADGGATNTNKYLSIASNLGINGGPISISAWVKMTGALDIGGAPGSNGQQWAVGHSASAAPYIRESIGAWNDQGTKKVAAYRALGHIKGFYNTHDTAIDDNMWHHIVMTYDGSHTTLWLDGVDRGDLPSTGKGTGAQPDYVHILADDAINFFKGMVDEVVILDRVLTDSEIGGLYNDGEGIEACSQPGCSKAATPVLPSVVSIPPSDSNTFFFPQVSSEVITSPQPTEGILLPDPAHPIIWEAGKYQIEVVGVSFGNVTIVSPASGTLPISVMGKNELFPYGILTDGNGTPFPVGATPYAATLYVNFYNRGPEPSYPPLATIRRIKNESGTSTISNTPKFNFSDGKTASPRAATLYPFRKIVFVIPQGQKNLMFGTGELPEMFFSTKIDNDGVLKLERILPGEGPDTTPPSVPTDINIINSGGQPWFAISWQSSTDNIGVWGYRIYRDGMPLIGTASSTFYLDGYGPFPTSHRYSVAAFDAAGNISAPSEEKFNYPTGEEHSVLSPVSSCSLTASPTRIVTPPSRTASLLWDCPGATGGTIHPGGILLTGSDFPTGSRQVMPSSTTTYTLTTAGSSGVMTSSAEVKVYIFPGDKGPIF